MAALEVHISRFVRSLLDMERMWASFLKLSRWGTALDPPPPKGGVGPCSLYPAPGGADPCTWQSSTGLHH